MDRLANKDGVSLKTKLILELCANHNGEISHAKEMIDQAFELRATGVKFQKRNLSLLPDDIKMKTVSGKNYFGNTYIEHKEKLEFSIEQIRELKGYTEDKGLLFVCSAFDIPSARDLVRIGVAHIKLASQYFQNIQMFQALRDLPCVKHISTGMHTVQEINTSFWLNVADVLYFCTSLYPAEMYHSYIGTIKQIRRKGQLGYSSHDIEGKAIKYAVLSGVGWVERHFTFDKKAQGSDHRISSDYREIEKIIDEIKEAEEVDCNKEVLCTEEQEIKEKYQWCNDYVK